MAHTPGNSTTDHERIGPPGEPDASARLSTAAPELLAALLAALEASQLVIDEMRQVVDAIAKASATP